jgi:ATP-dependent Clp protease adaptor protein ClpS
MGKIGFELDSDVETTNKTLPMWNVIILNDDHHTVQYVVLMLMQLFGKSPEQGLKCAENIHLEGQCIVDVTSKERAELKQEQVHAYGPDPLVKNCAGSMTCVIEPVE